MKVSATAFTFAAAVAAHGDHGHDQDPLAGPHQGLWYNTLPGDGGTQAIGDLARGASQVVIVGIDAVQRADELQRDGLGVVPRQALRVGVGIV